MKHIIAYLIAGGLIGAFACHFWLSRASVPMAEFQAVQEAHVRAMAAGADYRAEAVAHLQAAVDAQNTADSLRRLRPDVRTKIIASPDSAARKAGVTATAPTPQTRCIPLADLASLLADRAELGIADSAARWDNVGVSACLSALSYFDSAETVARENAVRLYGAAESLSEKVQTARRDRWLWAAGGAAVAVLAVIAGGAL